MACTGKKLIVKNISSTIAIVNYTRYSDGLVVEGQQINVGSTVTLYYQNGTYSTANPNQLQVISISDLPDGCGTTTTTTSSTTTTTTTTSNIDYIEVDPNPVGNCDGKKQVVTNISDAIAVVSYNRYSDNFFVDEQQINPGSTVSLYYYTGTLYTAFINQLQKISIENLPVGCDITPTPTQTPTQTQTPSNTPGLLTPTPTPTTTSSPTPTNTLTPTQTSTPTPTSTVTPTFTPTSSPTPTVTPTSGNTPTPTPTVTVTPTNSLTPTPSPTFAGPPALIFMESSDDADNPGGSSSTDILAYMIATGATQWFGFQNSGLPNFSIAAQVTDFLLWMDWPGFVNGTSNNTNGTITAGIPQSSGGVDTYGNVIDAYTFYTSEIPAGSVTGNIYYVILAPTSMTNGQVYSQIGIDYFNSPQSLQSVFTEPSVRGTNINYTGSNWYNTTYRVYTQSPNNGFNFGVPGQTDTTNNYFRGSTLI